MNSTEAPIRRSGHDVPTRASDDYVEQTFDGLASSFEEPRQNRLSYLASSKIGMADVLPLGTTDAATHPLAWRIANAG